MDNISEVITGVEEIKSNSYLRCYPNPFQNNITIETGIPINENFNLEIYDVSGKLIKKFINKQLQNNYSWDGRNMNGDDMLPGLYIVQLVSRGKAETVKIVKTR